MRLLNVFTMKLEEYFGSQIPGYDILSHCWGTEEITFGDINGSTWREKDGALKIVNASFQCRSRANHQRRYIWIDTCCIDKSSSAELSEAINSMYNWYKRSVVCFAYLGDVDKDVEDEIRKSRWFTRGWTLQELVAPKEVIFFDKNWNYLGDKNTLSTLLSQITTIPEAVLANPPRHRSCSLARKMSWAAGRETTREEDIAYCLLGLFEVNMPLLYGEGARAFIRLQEEIIKETDDQSLFAW
ncbi:HET-domain-containing protein, partial [Hyaloscypha bicolor E]